MIWTRGTEERGSAWNFARRRLRRTWKRGKNSEKRARLTTGSDLFKLEDQRCTGCKGGDQNARPPRKEGDGNPKADVVRPAFLEVLDALPERPAVLEALSSGGGSLARKYAKRRDSMIPGSAFASPQPRARLGTRNVLTRSSNSCPQCRRRRMRAVLQRTGSSGGGKLRRSNLPGEGRDSSAKRVSFCASIPFPPIRTHLCDYRRSHASIRPEPRSSAPAKLLLRSKHSRVVQRRRREWIKPEDVEEDVGDPACALA